MQSNKKNIKTTCTENEMPEVPLPADKVAEIAGCSESLVKKVNTGVRKADTPTGEKIEAVKDMWNYGSNLLIKEIKKRINL